MSGCFSLVCCTSLLAAIEICLLVRFAMNVVRLHDEELVVFVFDFSNFIRNLKTNYRSKL